ncbi:DUF2065 domain-containing protein [Alteromonas sp. BZK5]|uniref:DUF2065 domain-containing protein n=1 Tax=Alteromonas sp. BZK5 TaxID=1904459 RepID=UPI001653A9FC|nr:DUF2065 domain-containing protein [Alteromonas sp. BZK5]MBC6984894.1 DUF2065 domain-containing protein [Alteromonas sp. BZK5]
MGWSILVDHVRPLLFPNKWRNYLLQISQQPSNQLRQIGGTLVIIGALLLFYFS